MRFSIDHILLALVLGMLPLLILAQLPASGYLWLLALGIVALWRIPNRFVSLCGWSLVGFIWASYNSGLLLKQIDKHAGNVVNAVVQLETADLGDLIAQPMVWPQTATTVKTRWRLEQINGEWVYPPLAFTTYWLPKEQRLCAGQRWQVRVLLQPVHSRLNQGGFDGQRWALAQRQPFSGKIVRAQLLEGRCNLRQQVIQHMDAYLQPMQHRAVLLALGFGERRLFTQEQRSLFLQTGIAHIMAISGLHVTMAAFIAWSALRLLQGIFPARYLSYRWPLIGGALLALIYVWLAGAQPPAVRAMIALSIWLVLRLQGWRCSSWQVWLRCVAAILLIDPLVLLSDSFWLSCLAVAALIFWFEWAALPYQFRQRWLWAPLRWFHLQAGMSLLLLPMQIGLFQGISLTALPANLWVIPIISLFTVPVLLLAMLFSFQPTLADLLWYLADLSLSAALWPLGALQQGWITLSAAVLIFAGSGWLAVIIWRFQGWRHYPIAIGTLLVTSWLLRNDSAREAGWRMTMLDVGHGLAVVIERQGKAVLYDMADRWLDSSIAEISILPYMQWRQLQLEQMIISHSHQDHQGGLEAMRQAFPQASIRSPVINAGHLPCTAGQRWQWQGLNFQVLWPPQRVQRAGNNESCVVRIDDGQHSILLTGDIEKAAERQLLQISKQQLQSDILQIPHHGSKTSSWSPFLRAVAPQAAMLSTARFNRWELPTQEVTQRFQNNAIPWWDTPHSGQITVRFFDNAWIVNGFREELMPRWYHQRFGVKRDNR